MRQLMLQVHTAAGLTENMFSCGFGCCKIQYPLFRLAHTSTFLCKYIFYLLAERVSRIAFNFLFGRGEVPH
uniref:Uncharacterized protein n=1 Tax=Anguilla anguilla TaxID=7936 RepID=A0A0E9PAS2_ANGAN